MVGLCCVTGFGGLDDDDSGVGLLLPRVEERLGCGGGPETSF